MMRKFILAAASALGFLLITGPAALAQSGCQYIAAGAVLTPAQWNFCFSQKQNVIGFVPVNKAGDTMLGRLTMTPSTALSAGINIAPGVAPTSPNNGDTWITAAGIFVRVNGVTVGPLTGPGSAAFAGSAPISVSFPAGVVTYALGYDSNFTVSGSNLALNSIASGSLLANCSGGSAEPTGSTWTACLDRNVGSSNGMLPYRVGGVWANISTGTSGATIPRNDTANVFSLAQTALSYTATLVTINTTVNPALTINTSSNNGLTDYQLSGVSKFQSGYQAGQWVLYDNTAGGGGRYVARLNSGTGVFALQPTGGSVGIGTTTTLSGAILDTRGSIYQAVTNPTMSTADPGFASSNKGALFDSTFSTAAGVGVVFQADVPIGSTGTSVQAARSNIHCAAATVECIAHFMYSYLTDSADNGVTLNLGMRGSISNPGRSGNVGVQVISPEADFSPSFGLKITHGRDMSNNLPGHPAYDGVWVLDVLNAPFRGDQFGRSAVFEGRRLNGTNTAPTVLVSGDLITSHEAYGWTPGGWSAASRGSFEIRSNETWTNAANGTIGVIKLTPSGSIVPTDVATFTNTTQPLMGVGISSPLVPGHFYGAQAASGSAQFGIIAEDRASMAAGVGGGIGFYGQYTNGGLSTLFASVQGTKINSTTGDFGGNLVGTVNVNNVGPKQIFSALGSDLIFTLGQAGTTAGRLGLSGSSSGSLILRAPAIAGTNTLTFPAGTTDFSATGGTSQFVKQAGAGAALTVVRPVCADLSDSGSGCSAAAGITALTGDVTASGSGSVAATLATTQPAVHTWSLAQTFTVAPVFTDQSGSQTALGLGTAATQNTGTSGATVPLLSTANTWSLAQTFTTAPVFTNASGSRTALGLGSIATQNASAVAITGGTLAGLTGLAVRDTSAAFDVTFAAVSSTALTAGRTLTFDVVNAARTIKLGSNLTIASDLGTVTGALKSNGSGTFAQAACSDLSNGATGCSTATGTSGATIPLLNGANTWSGTQSFNSGNLAHKGATSGTLTINAAAVAGTNTLTFPAGTTDFSATGGTSQVVKQVSSGAAFTVARLACADLSDATGACSATYVSGSAWTPADNSGAGLTFGSVSSSYNRVGNMVWVATQFTYPITASGAAASISGLPLTVGPNNGNRGPCETVTTAAAVTLSFIPAVNTTTGAFFSLAGVTAITNSQLSNSVIIIGCWYALS